MKKIHLTEYIGKTGESVTLTDAERAKLLSVTKEYMALKPVRTELVRRRTPILSAYVFARKPLALALIALLVISSGAGVSYAAENALPGDVLYSVKVSVNEEVRALAAVTREDKAEWEAQRAEKRLAEASALAAKGKLTPAAEADLMARFAKHADKAVAHVETLEGRDSAVAIDVASDFETSVAAHIEILDEVGGANEELRTLALQKVRRVSDIRASAENGIAVSVTMAASTPGPATFAMTMKSAAEDSSARIAADFEADDGRGEERKNAALRMSKSANKSFADAARLFEKAKTKFTVEEQARLTLAMREAKTNIDAGDAAVEAEDFGTAFHAYQKAFVSLKKLSVFLKTSLRGGIKLRIEPLPPPEAVMAPDAVSPTSADPASSKGVRGTPVQFTSPEFAEDSPLPAIQILPYSDDVKIQVEGDSSSSVQIHTETKTEGTNAETKGFIRIRVD